MEHLALYRKYRPTIFEDVIGQDHIIKTLINQIARQEISHAYLFNGTRGTGKTSTAKIFAKAINCLTPKNGSPCLECSVCKELNAVNNLDIFEIDAASNNRVDEIRDLREKIKYPPVHGKYKVYIIDEVHMLTDSAFNALLKTLEEPPAHAVFILATTEVHKLPATILSRVMRFDFKLVGIEDLSKLLIKIFKSAKITCDKEALKAIAIAGEGSVRDTLSVADVCASYSANNITYSDVLNALGTTTKSVLINLTNAIINKDAKEILLTINKIASEGKNLGVLTKDITSHFRDLLVIKSVKDANSMLNLPEDIYKEMSEQAKKENSGNLLFYMQKLGGIEGELRYSSNERLLIETATLSCISENFTVIENLEKRIITLENGSGVTQIKKTTRQLEKATPLVVDNNKVVVKNKKKLIEIKKEIINNYEAINIKQLWGKTLISLRESNKIILYTLCGEVIDTKIEQGVFVLSVDNSSAFSTLSKQENIKTIEDVLKIFDVNVKVKIIKTNKGNEQKDPIIEKLTKKFGNKLKIVN